MASTSYLRQSDSGTACARIGTGLPRPAFVLRTSIFPASRIAAISLASLRGVVEAFTVVSPTRACGAPQRFASLAGEHRGFEASAS